MRITNSEEFGRQEDRTDSRRGSCSATMTYDTRASSVWHVTTFSQRRDSARSSGVTLYSARSSCVTPNSTCFFVFPSFPAGCSGLFHGRIFLTPQPNSSFTSSSPPHTARAGDVVMCVRYFYTVRPQMTWDFSFMRFQPRLAHAHTRKLLWQRHIQETLANKLYAGTRALKPHDTDREYWLEETWQESHDITTAQSHVSQTQHKVSAARFARSVWDITWFAGVTNNVVNLIFDD